MRYKIDLKNERLILTADAEERAALAAMREENPDSFDSDDFMYDLLENLVTNDSFEWLPEGVTGDLTSAPMLGITGEDEVGPDDYHNAECTGFVNVGRWEAGTMYRPVLYRWAFMNYAVTSPQRELLEKGAAVFTGGEYLEREGQMVLCYAEREFTARTPYCVS